MYTRCWWRESYNIKGADGFWFSIRNRVSAIAIAALARVCLLYTSKVDQLKFRPKRKKEKMSISDAELKQLEALEKKEGKSKLDDN